MSVKLMSAVFEANIGSPIDKLVLLALADFAADDGTSVYPSIKTLAMKCDADERTCQRSLRRMAGKYLVMVREATPTSARRYRLIAEAIRGVVRAPLEGGVAQSHPTRSLANGEGGVAQSHQGGGATPPNPSVESDSTSCGPTSTAQCKAPNRGNGHKPSFGRRGREITDFQPTPVLQEADREIHPIRYVLTCFDLAFLKKIGERYPTFTGQDARLAESLLKKSKLPVDRLVKMVEYFFKADDEWVHDKGYTFGIFYTQRGKLVVKTSKVPFIDPYAHLPKAPPPPPGWTLEPLKKQTP